MAYLPYLLHRSPRSHDLSDPLSERRSSSEPVEVDLHLDPTRSAEQARVPAPPPPEVSIILATLNEAKNIPILLHEIETTFAVSHEVIVVDNGSTDGTREFLDGWAATHPNLRRIYNPGKQTTLRAHYQALREASGRYAIVMDSDLQHPTATIGQIYGRLKLGFDVVVASRDRRGDRRGTVARSEAWSPVVRRSSPGSRSGPPRTSPIRCRATLASFGPGSPRSARSTAGTRPCSSSSPRTPSSG